VIRIHIYVLYGWIELILLYVVIAERYSDCVQCILYIREAVCNPSMTILLNCRPDASLSAKIRPASCGGYTSEYLPSQGARAIQGCTLDVLIQII
jgi:hypothetical protein